MALKVSTGLRNAVLASSSMKAALDGGQIDIYSGTPPATADDAVTGDLLCTISLNGMGDGIHFNAEASGGTLSKDPTEAWSGTCVTSGPATYYRFVAPGDDGTASGTQPRLQGTVATAGADLNLSSIELVEGAVQTINYYSVALPTL